MIISVSRRCDIPRFQFDWFIERINAGFVDTVNPYNPAQKKRVPLVPMRRGMKAEDGVDIFIFWTREPRPILTYADELTQRGYPFYVMVSLTGYPGILEPNQAFVPDVLISMKELAKKIGSDRVIWRYDPVILTGITNEDFHRRNFKEIAQNLSGSVERVIVSIFDEYRCAKKRFDELEKAGKINLLKDDNGSYYRVLKELADCAREAGMEIHSCAEKEDFSPIGIKGGACIDSSLIEKICGAAGGEVSSVKISRDKNQRPNCLCCKSIDIGLYKTCAAHCVYCYAW
ncbi:MAG: DUF1848 domain-containing protein [Treponema sp.]|nr:DUF1848 domain-containing protein [Treponema sp.]